MDVFFGKSLLKIHDIIIQYTPLQSKKKKKKKPKVRTYNTYTMQVGFQPWTSENERKKKKIREPMFSYIFSFSSSNNLKKK